MNPIIKQALPQLQALCTRHHVAQLYLFGSAAGAGFGPESDVDLVVRFKADEIDDYAGNYFTFWDNLENIFNRKVDLVTDNAIRNPYFRKSVDQSKVLLYHGQSA